MVQQWPDLKVRGGLLWYIGKNTIGQRWRYTAVDEVHPELADRVSLQHDELAIVSSFISPASWYLLTTRRILGWYFGDRVDEFPLAVKDYDFCNFKGFGEKETEAWILRGKDETLHRLEFETRLASMAPIYYMRFWRIKYPVLGKLTV